MYLFDMDKQSWGEILPGRTGHIRPATYRHQSVLLGENTMCVFGGVSYEKAAAKRSDTLYFMDVERNHWRVAPRGRGLVPMARSSHSMVPFGSGGNVFALFGGWDGDRFFNDVYLFDVRENHWHRTSPVPSSFMPSKRCRQSCVAFGPKLYVVGGYGGGKTLSDICSFDFRSRVWENVDYVTENVEDVEFDSEREKAWMLERTLPSYYSRCSHTATLYRGSIMIVGGYHKENGAMGLLHDVCVYDLTNQRLYRTDVHGIERVGPRQGHAMARYDPDTQHSQCAFIYLSIRTCRSACPVQLTSNE
jgi:hypothetical protein